MTKRDVEIQALLLRHRANGCLSGLVKWQNSFNAEQSEIAMKALQERYHQLEAEADGLDSLAEQWEEFGPHFANSPPAKQ